ncbi:MAG: LysR family transcriptional regulator [Roseibium sp.]|uniref:LysR family transcriptional regulator n=1 Tax=Roseibium sp. TaxID=1936156 RepID=UPI00261B6B40|nr:LysR family transcriptional regulator [Roseibium sp.]MCV0427740.1 LysR family transcriptional regulator [Roseibium sp.]
MDPELLTDMAVFAAVVENNGFTSAANVMNMSKSNVSRRISALEDRLSLKLIHRTTRKIGLTESGRVYYEYCARLVAEGRAADAAMMAMNSSPSGLLNVSLPETLGRSFILPLLPKFLESYPNIRLNVAFSNRKVDLIEERCDVAVRKGEIEDDTLCAVPLGSSSQYLFAAPGYLGTTDEIRSPADLEAHAFVASRTGFGPLRVELTSGNDATEVTVLPRVGVKDHEAVLSLTISGMGVSLLPAWLAREHVATGELAAVLPQWRGPSVMFNAVFHPHRGMAPSLRAFVTFLKDHFKAHRPLDDSESIQKLQPRIALVK